MKLLKFYLIAGMMVFLMTGTAGAQHVNIGIKGGLNIYNFHHEDYKYDYKTGFHAGLIAHIHLARTFALQPEVMYSRQGAMYKDFAPSTKVKLDYINVPVLFQYMFDNGFRLQAGPQVGFLMNARTENKDYNIDHKNDLEPIDIGIAMGMSYVSKSGFGIDARYVHGLTNIYKNNSSKTTNRGFQLGLFYLFKHKS